MKTMNIDLETFSSVDIKSAGLYAYVQSPDFQVMLFAYSPDGGPVSVVDLMNGESLPGDVVTFLFDPECRKIAYNAAFEWYCLSKYFSLDEKSRNAWLTHWRDTMLHGLYCGFPAGLDAVGKALSLPEVQQKLSTGKSLIRTFCVPCKPCKSNGGRTRTLPKHEPEKWELFKTYNAQDVATEMEVAIRLAPWPVPEEIQEQWVTDQINNARGVAIDRKLVAGALALGEKVKVVMTAEAKALTGLENPNSVAQLKDWLTKETGEDIPNLQKATVEDLLAGEVTSANARRMLEIRQELGKTSTKKYDAMAAAVCEDGRVRGLLQFYGANRTGRWAGRIIQPQNLPRTYLPMPMQKLARELVQGEKLDALRMVFGSVTDTLSQLIRTALVPAPGHVFLDADFSAIEARVLAWLAGEEWRLEVFRTHGKIYEASASQMFGVPLSLIVKGNPEYALRQRGKVAELALGYQGSIPALTQMDTSKTLTEEEKPGIVQQWRAANKQIVSLWYRVQTAAIHTVRTGQPTNVRGIGFALVGAVGSEEYFMTITLPSSRKLFYCRPRIVPGKYGDAISYWGMNQTSKKWCPLETYGGKLVENITQAIARDCLAEAITRLEAAGYPVVFHVHDEVVVEYKDDRLQEIVEIMSKPMPWAPDLPLGADGWVGEFFTKD
ncbi:DNA polymerase [Ruminococcaceae bacterium OttesenSCG-928-I18]|nr:DNA polymerase [Ruminococcaceae bacterium OttesenSCG-928-I18]